MFSFHMHLIICKSNYYQIINLCQADTIKKTVPSWGMGAFSLLSILNMATMNFISFAPETKRKTRRKTAHLKVTEALPLI